MAPRPEGRPPGPYVSVCQRTRPHFLCLEHIIAKMYSPHGTIAANSAIPTFLPLGRRYDDTRSAYPQGPILAYPPGPILANPPGPILAPITQNNQVIQVPGVEYGVPTVSMRPLAPALAQTVQNDTVIQAPGDHDGDTTVSERPSTSTSAHTRQSGEAMQVREHEDGQPTGPRRPAGSALIHTFFKHTSYRKLTFMVNPSGWKYRSPDPSALGRRSLPQEMHRPQTPHERGRGSQ